MCYDLKKSETRFMKHTPVFYDHICKKYGNVFLSLDHDIRNDLSAFVHWLNAHPVAYSLLSQKACSAPLARHIIQMFCDEHTIHAQARGALYVLSKYDRISYLKNIIDYMNLHKNNTVDVFVTSAHPITNQHKTTLGTALSHVTHRLPTVHVTHNQDLVAGMTVEWDCHLIDASLAKRIQSLSLENL